jgi:hypothetical protein
MLPRNKMNCIFFFFDKSKYELHFILLKFCLGSGGLVEMPQPFLLIYFGLLLMHVASLQ